MNSGTVRLKLETKANIRNISDIHNNLSAAFADGSDVELDAGACVEADLSLVQLIEAARIKARTTGQSFELSSPVNAELSAVLERAGFLANATADDRRFWFKEGVQVS